MKLNMREHNGDCMETKDGKFGKETVSVLPKFKQIEAETMTVKTVNEKSRKMTSDRNKSKLMETLST